MKRALSIVLSAALLAPPAFAAERVDLDAVTRIREEALRRGQVMDHLTALCDDAGPRLVGSPGARRAVEWTRDTLTKWGLTNVELLPDDPLAQSWEEQRVMLRMLAPAVAPIPARAKAFTPGTNGLKKASAVLVTLESDADFAAWKGKLSGKIVVLATSRKFRPHTAMEVERFDDRSLAALGRFETGMGDYHWPRETVLQFVAKADRLRDFLVKEKALAVLEASSRDDGTISLQGTYWIRPGDGLPTLVIPFESHGRLARLLEAKRPVDLELEVVAVSQPADPVANSSVLADLPGSDRKDEIVMVGAHLDSWHGATGAADNGAGVAVAMEAVRLLKEAGLTPRRTIRIALWNGEEVGYLGSQTYVDRNLVTRSLDTSPAQQKLPPSLRTVSGKPAAKAAHAKHVAYFNLDNGGGRIRGINAQENAAVRAVFAAWMKPVSDLGASLVTLRNTSGTDHIPFDEAGIPAFQFVQDELDYMSRTHHSTADTVERVPKSDVTQAAIVVATFLWQAANRDEPLPRKALR